MCHGRGQICIRAVPVFSAMQRSLNLFSVDLAIPESNSLERTNVMPTTWNALYLGNSSTQIDSAEGNLVAENAGNFVGETYGSTGAPLSSQIVSVTTLEAGGDSSLMDVDDAGDKVQFDLGDGAGTQTNDFDGGALYNATITYSDGSTAQITAAVFQDANGNLFLAPEFSENTDVAAMEAGAIESISLDSVAGDTFSGMVSDRVLTEFVCFAPGTEIATPLGPRPVETLNRGDLIETLDDGPQPLLWRGARTLDFRVSGSSQKPVEIKPDAFGEGLPSRRLVLSPQHRVLLLDGRDEVLAIAKALIPASGVRRMEGVRQVTYHTLLMRSHSVILAQGLAVESFYPGPYALSLLTPAQRLCVLAHFPELQTDPLFYGPHARPLLSREAAEKRARAGRMRGIGIVHQVGVSDSGV